MVKATLLPTAVTPEDSSSEADSKVMHRLRSLHLVRNPVVLLELRQDAEDLRARLQGDLTSKESQKASTDDKLVKMALGREIPEIEVQIKAITKGLASIETRTDEIATPTKAKPVK